MKAFRILLFISVFSMLAAVSCKKDADNNDITAAEDNALAESESDKILQAVNTVVNDSGLNRPAAGESPESIFPACSSVSFDTSGVLHTITIQFDSACLCTEWDGRYRSGTIEASWTGNYRDSGTVITIITIDYYQGVLPSQMNRFDYAKTVTNLGHNQNGNLHFGINVSNATITYYSGEVATWTSQRDREWIEGESTMLPLDDKYSITGTASGVDRNSNPYNVNITSPLIVAFLCPWVEQGSIEVLHGNLLPTATIDYGDGTCDYNATITINGLVFPLVLG